MFETSLYNEADFPAFAEYIRLNFHPRYILGHKKYLDWQYQNSLHILKAGGKIVGHFGYRDIKYKLGEKGKLVRVLMNLFVLPEYRTFGGGAELSKSVLTNADLVMVSGYTPATTALCTRLVDNWQELGNLGRFIKILNSKNHLLTGYEIPPTVSKTGLNSDVKINVENDPAILEKAWLSARSRYRVTVERSYDYLKRRFIDNPFIKYTIFSCFKNDSVCGYVVGRTESDQGFKIARIIDFIALPESEASLINIFVNWAEENSCDAVDFLFSGQLYRSVLRDAGFFNISGTDFENFPILFSPISHKKTYINIASNLDFPLEECYFNKADGDQDRPNPH